MGSNPKTKTAVLSVASILAVGLSGCAMPQSSIPPRAAFHGPAQRNPDIARPAAEAQDSPTTSSLTLAGAIALGLENNPQLQADYRRVEALLLEVPQVSSLDDPMVEVGQREAFRGPDDDRENMVGISQSFPWFGKRRLRGLIAGSEATEALADYRMAVLELRRGVQTAWWRLAYSQENARLLVEEQRLIEEARGAALALYQSGQRDRTSLLRLDTEGAMIAGMVEENAGLGRGARHELERLTSSPLAGPSLEADLAADLPSQQLDLAELLDLAIEYRPELAAFAEAEKRAALQERLARAEYSPDFTVGAGLTGMGMRSGSFYEPDSDSRTDSLQASVGINIPIPNARRRAAVEQARLRGEEARLRQDAVADQIGQELGSFQAMIESLREQARLYTGTIIPLANEAFQSTRAAYQSGTASYADLIDVQRTLITARREQLRMRRDLAIATAELERALGAPLTEASAPKGGDQ